MKAPVHITITGGAGQIAYSLLPSLASGSVFGPDQPVCLRLLDIPPAIMALNGVVMELEDLAYPLLANAIATTDPAEGFKDADYAVFLGAFPRKEGMERKDVMEKNINIFNSQGSALSKNAKSTVKCLVVGNPANTNAAILAKAAPNVKPENITALTRLDHNRATSMIANKLNVSCTEVEGVCIWGNHSSTQFPDVSHGTVSGVPVKQAVLEKFSDNGVAWLQGEFITSVQKRGAAVIAARKLSSAASAAKAICDHLRDWTLGTAKVVSMGVQSDGNEYGIPSGLVYSFPVTCANGTYTIVNGLTIDEFSRKMMDATAAELVEEAALAQSFLK